MDTSRQEETSLSLAPSYLEDFVQEEGADHIRQSPELIRPDLPQHLIKRRLQHSHNPNLFRQNTAYI